MKLRSCGSLDFLELAACNGRPARRVARLGLNLVAISTLACHHPGKAGVQPTPLDSAHAQMTLARVAARSVRSVVSLKCLDSTGKVLRLGSGFIIVGGRVVTNAHLVRGCSRVEVRGRSAEVLLTTRSVVAYCNSADVAVLPAIPSQPPGLHLKRNAPVVGDRVVVIGTPGGSNPPMSVGLVSAVPTAGDGRLMQITGQGSPGSPGGPILDLHGDVVGIAVGERQDRTFAVAASVITPALAGGVLRVALTAIPGDQEEDNAQGAQRLEATAPEDSTVAAGIRQAKAIVDSAIWDTASAIPCTRQRDTVCLRKLRDGFVPRIAGARTYLSAGFASHDSTIWLMTALVAESGGSKLAEAGAYDQAYEWLDQLLTELARDASGFQISLKQQIRVRASFWFGLADAVTIQVPYRQLVQRKSCMTGDTVKQRIQRGLDALEVGASVAPMVASQMRNILLQYLSDIDRVTQAVRCNYC